MSKATQIIVFSIENFSKCENKQLNFLGYSHFKVTILIIFINLKLNHYKIANKFGISLHWSLSLHHRNRESSVRESKTKM